MSISQKLMSAAGKRSFDPNTPIGTFIEGGFFAGIITQGGDDFAIIVSPRAQGQAINIQWKNTASAGPIATRTLNNGASATAAMVADGNATVYPAAHFCNNLSINGFSDFYMPARDELELCYRNLKPSTNPPNTNTRDKSTFVYPEGNDVAGDTIGVNRNSIPTGSAYTSNNPARTSLSIFQTAGSEGFPPGEWWSSSDFSDAELPSQLAWRQNVGDNGFQGGTFKTSDRRVRAVRRVKI